MKLLISSMDPITRKPSFRTESDANTCKMTKMKMRSNSLSSVVYKFPSKLCFTEKLGIQDQAMLEHIFKPVTLGTFCRIISEVKLLN